MNWKRIKAGDAYLVPAEGGYVKGYAESDGILIAAEPVDIFVSHEDLREMWIEANAENVDLDLSKLSEVAK